jgi:conjugal transfer pilin signal peptidase TrbI
MTTMNDRVLRGISWSQTSTLARVLFMLGFLLVFAAIGLSISQRWDVRINSTESLKGVVFVFDKQDRRPIRGELIEFNAPANPYIESKYVLGKRVVGMPGDVVEFRGRDVLINGQFVHTAKKVSLRGDRLDLLSDGKAFVIDSGYYYVAGEHKDSFDSRYSIFGLIPQSAVIGTGRAVF